MSFLDLINSLRELSEKENIDPKLKNNSFSKKNIRFKNSKLTE